MSGGLRFTVDGAYALQFAAAPTIAFGLRIENRGADAIRSVALDVQIRLAATTLGSLFWTRATVLVPTSDPASLTEGGTPVPRLADVAPGEPPPGHARVVVGSGRYRFAAAAPAPIEAPLPRAAIDEGAR